MVQAINRNHAKNKIVTYTDDCFYIYNDGLWVKPSTNYYKYFDTDISSLDVNSFNLNDYILSYKSKTNHIKYSETFKPNECKINDISQWTVQYLSQSNSDDYRFPNTGKQATKFQTNNSVSDPITEHSLSQIFYTKPNELYIATCMVKQISTTTNNIAFQLFNDTYNIGITANYNLNDTTGYDADGYKSIPTFYLNSGFNDASSSSVTNHFRNVSAGLYRIEDESGYYFRLVIKCSCDFNSQMRVKLLLLNNNSEYKYSSKQGQEKYILYINAFQLEKYSDLTISKPSEYMISTDKNSTLKLLDKSYKVYINPQTSRKEFAEIYNKLYYIYDIKEHSEVIPGIGLATYLESYNPPILTPVNGDIAVVPSIISFTEYKSNKGNVVEDSMVRFGDEFNIDNPNETINYDLINSQYRIKTDNSFKILSYESEEKNRKSMVKAMTFNQGYFETWCKQDRGNFYKFGYNTGGGMNFTRLIKIFPHL